MRPAHRLCDWAIGFALGAAIFGNWAHAAQPAYPTRPVRLVVPFAPGGGADALARILAPRLHEALGQPWVVDNRGGAAGNLAAEIVARAAPDGHTVLLGFSTVLTVNPSLYRLAFDVEKDFQPVTPLAAAQYLLVVHPSVPAASVQELIAVAKERAGALNYATAGVGSPLHLAGELFKRRAGISMVPIAYKGGGPAAAAVLAGEVQVIFGSVASSLPHVKAGRLRALATTGIQRSRVAPELPTLAESGFPGFDVTSWYAWLLPAGTAATIAERLRVATLQVIARPEVEQAMARQGLEAETGTPQQLAARIRKETALWAQLVREAGIKLE